MYIMLDHNKKSYQWFLEILYGFRLYFVCYCCCKKMIIQQLNDIREEECTTNVDDNKGSKKDNCLQIENTEYGTKINDISVNHAKIEICGSLSAETIDN